MRLSLGLLLLSATLCAQLLDPAKLKTPPTDTWPTYNGDYTGQRHSPLKQINSFNVKTLGLVWTHHVELGQMSRAQQSDEGHRIKATPLLVKGVLYFTTTDNVWAMDARSGRELWHWTWPNNRAIHVANHGLGMYGNWLYYLTPDNWLVSIRALDGKERWKVQVADVNQDFFSSTAPMVIGNHVIVGPGNNDDIRAFLESHDPETGALQWKWWVTPDPGQPGSETWTDSETMLKGGGFPWLTGTYDPELNLYYFGTGNGVPVKRAPHPNEKGEDSLYTASILAINPDSGKIAWHFQATPHDNHDWDAAQTPIIFDADFGGRKRKLLAQVSRNGYFFLLDRTTGEHLLTTKYMPETNWAKGINQYGHPIPNYLKDSRPEGTLVSPYALGATNWWAPAYDPKRGLIFVNASRTFAFLTPVGYGRLSYPVQYVTMAIDYKSGKVTWAHELGDKSGNLISGLLIHRGWRSFRRRHRGKFSCHGPGYRENAMACESR